MGACVGERGGVLVRSEMSGWKWITQNSVAQKFSQFEGV